MGMLAAPRGARDRSGISEADLTERLGADARDVLDEAKHLGADSHLSSLRRYAGARGMTLELAVIELAGDLLR